MNRVQRKVKRLNATAHTKTQKIINTNRMNEKIEQDYQSEKDWLLFDYFISDSALGDLDDY